MAKRYYWLKLKNDFFKSKIIKKLRKIAGGDTYTIIYLKMQLLSLQNAGKILYEGVEDTLADELALELEEDPDNVSITLAFLEKYDLVEKVENNEFLLPQAVAAIGSETTSATRVRRYREKEKALQCNASVTNGNKNVTTETETEQEIEIEIEQHNSMRAHKDITKNDICQAVNSVDSSDVVDVLCKKCNLELHDVNVHIEKYGENYVKTKLLLLSVQKNVKNKGAWLRRALENDYQVRDSIAKADANCKKCNGVGYITFFENLTNETCKIKCDCR